jgi:hypothetical protein
MCAFEEEINLKKQTKKTSDKSAIHRLVNSHLCYSPVNSTFQTN